MWQHLLDGYVLKEAAMEFSQFNCQSTEGKSSFDHLESRFPRTDSRKYILRAGAEQITPAQSWVLDPPKFIDLQDLEWSSLQWSTICVAFGTMKGSTKGCYEHYEWYVS